MTAVLLDTLYRVPGSRVLYRDLTAMPFSLDTTDDARDAQRDAYRRLGGPARVEIVFRLNALVRQTAMAGIRRRHPAYTERDVIAAYRRLTLGDELVRQVYPDQPLVDP